VIAKESRNIAKI